MKKILIGLLVLGLGVQAQAQKISQMPAGDALVGTETIPMYQIGHTVTVATNPGAIAAYVISQLSQGDITSLFNESANTVFAGPVSGGPATAAFRLLVSADIPNNAANTSGNAGTATALAATPPQCTGSLATGITANGTANCSNVVGSPTGGSLGAGSLNMQACYVNGQACAIAATGCTTGSFTATVSSGFTSNPSGSMSYSLCGTLVTLWATSNLTGTSNAALTILISGAPSSIAPGTGSFNGACFFLEDNSITGLRGIIGPNAIVGELSVALTLAVTDGSRTAISDANNFTGSGTKGLSNGAVCYYSTVAT